MACVKEVGGGGLTVGTLNFAEGSSNFASTIRSFSFSGSPSAVSSRMARRQVTIHLMGTEDLSVVGSAPARALIASELGGSSGVILVMLVARDKGREGGVVLLCQTRLP